MPKKRNTSWSRSKKEKQIITARLIEISLKVDDYIYKHKLISAWEAEQYMREVSSYKEQCSGDERSLQVIEKLTRCMRAIMLDHQELRTENHSLSNVRSIPGGGVRATSKSPVYSIPDEDRTQFTQIDEGANSNVVIIDLSNIDDDDDSMHNASNTPTADYTGSRITVEVDIHKDIHISSLCLRDVEDPLDMAISTVANCSQSILNNFEGVEQTQQNEINITPQRAVAGGLVDNVIASGQTKNFMQGIGNNCINKISNKQPAASIEPHKTVKTAIVPNKPIIICNNKNNLKFDAVVQNKEPLKVTNTTSYRLTNSFNQKDNTITPQTFCTATNNIPEHQRQAWYDSNRTCTINDSSRTLADTNRFTQPRQIHKDVLEVNQVTVTKGDTWNNIPTNTFNTAEKGKQTITTENSRAPLQNKRLITNTAVVQEKPITTKKRRGPKKKLKDEKEIKPKNKRVFRGNPKKNKENTLINTNKNKTIPIYNENVVDDLSWIENIRYVREIRIDENDPKFNFEESFWDNCYLPANWSDSEFV